MCLRRHTCVVPLDDLLAVIHGFIEPLDEPLGVGTRLLRPGARSRKLT